MNIIRMCDEKPFEITNIHDIEIDEYFETIVNRDINVEPQYLNISDAEPVNSNEYYEDIINYFNPDPVEIIDETTDDTDDNHYPECGRYLLDCGDCICLELSLTKYLDLTIHNIPDLIL